MNCRSLVIACLMTLAACSGRPDSQEPPSDPTDFFYREAWQETQTNPSIRLHEQAPGRFFETTLRPTEMRALLPTAYLSRITRNYQPWAEQIYDVAYLSFDLDQLTALPPASGFSWGPPKGAKPNEVLIELGGWKASSHFTPHRIADIWDGEITEVDGHVIITSEKFPAGRSNRKYFFDQDSKGDLDGNPLIVSCFTDWKCTAHLVVAQELAGFLPLYFGKAKPYRGTTGAGLRITFHPDRIDDWEEVRRKAVCFAALSIQDLELKALASAERINCDDVRSAIEETIAD